MKEWLEVIRDHRYFNLLVLNNSRPTSSGQFEFGTRHGAVITVDYDQVYQVTDVYPGMDNPPDFIAVSDVHSYATPDSTERNLTPHAEEPAPAQRAGNVAFIWGKHEHGDVRPYRDDGFPAVVIATGLHKHYHQGNLNRKKQFPAIKAENLVAMWYENTPDIVYRNNGPASITLENYKEYWTDGVFKGHKWTDYHERWINRLSMTPEDEDEDTLGIFLESLNGTTSLFTDRYFIDQQDELCYIADFA